MVTSVLHHGIPLEYRGTLASGDDLDSIIGFNYAGWYNVDRNVAHSPTTYAALLVLPLSADSGSQILFRPINGEMYLRQRSGQPREWGSWYKLQGTVVNT